MKVNENKVKLFNHPYLIINTKKNAPKGAFHIY